VLPLLTSYLVSRSKGMTEQALAGLGYSDTIIFRPGFLANAERASGRLGEQIIE
jgi:oxidoreductase